MPDPVGAAAPHVLQSVLSSLLVLLIGGVAGWFLSRWNKGAKAIEQSETLGPIEQRIEAKIDDAVTRLEEALHAHKKVAQSNQTATDSRLHELELTLFGTKGRGGLARELEQLRRNAQADHDLLLYVTTLVRGMYRTTMNAEPPEPPPAPPSLLG